MTKEELFKKYSIDESHNKWESIDSWMSVEVYRIMHNGELPPPAGDTSTKWITDFLDQVNHHDKFAAKLMSERQDFGSLYLTAKRMICTLHEQILQNP